MTKNNTTDTTNENCCTPNSSCCSEPTPLPTVTGVTRRRFLLTASTVAAGFSMGGSLWASPMNEEQYSKLIRSHSSLSGYWRFDGDLKDVINNRKVQSNSPLSFEQGPLGSKAISLTPKDKAVINDADKLRGPSATIEMFFKILSEPKGKKDAVIIAQTKGQSVRYVIGVKHDLSCISYLQTRKEINTSAYLPTGKKLEVNRWYHLAITSFDLDVRIYIDGFECSIVGGALEFTRKGAVDTALSLGSSSLKNWESSTIQINELAFYNRGLVKEEIQKHLKESGWSKRFYETQKIVASVENNRNDVRLSKFNSMMNDPSLVNKGKTKSYEGKSLEAIAFTVGGIGTGAIQFNGNAEAGIWQIAKNFNHLKVANSFLAIRTEKNDNVVVRSLQTKDVGSFKGMQSLSMEGQYPFANYHFKDSALPVNVSLEVFNPLIPMDAKNSGIPCAIYHVKVKNTSTSKVNINLLAAQQNAIGYTSPAQQYGGNQNTIIKEGGASILHMSQKNQGKPSVNDMVLMTEAENTEGIASWTSNDALHSAFKKNESLATEKSSLSKKGKTVNGGLTTQLTLAPLEEKTVTFQLVWYFKTVRHGSKNWTGKGNMYNNWWENALDVASYLRSKGEELEHKTRLFHDTLYASDMPRWFVDRLSSQLAVLRSQTCWWSADGYFGAWEGVSPARGCCNGNCTHVWHYAQGHARLFPELGRKMREQDFAQQKTNGLIPFRHYREDDAADGLFGTVLNAYREHQCSTDNTWLQKHWAQIKKTMDGGIAHWNPSQDGFLETVQHNTLDGAMTGCSSWIGTLYLSALEAAARMAEIVNDEASAKKYRKIRNSGKKLQNDKLWNGEYYIQKVGNQRIQDYLDGCHIDQILGEWWSDQLDMDRNYPKDRAKKAMQSLLKYNFFTNFHGKSLKPRQYSTIDDGGMKMITWPKGNQPIPGMKYGDEIMTGFEYAAAATMIQNDMLKEGLVVLKTVADRYNGVLRTDGVTKMDTGPWGYSGNPFGDDECGKYYGRSLSVWSVLFALQGFAYDGPKKYVKFKPVFKPENHTSFFIVSEGYGLYAQTLNNRSLNASIEVKEGKITLKNIHLSLQKGQKVTSAKAKINGSTIALKIEEKEEGINLQFSKEITVLPKRKLEIQILS